jgi:hypothetical protein
VQRSATVYIELRTELVPPQVLSIEAVVGGMATGLAGPPEPSSVSFKGHIEPVAKTPERLAI